MVHIKVTVGLLLACAICVHAFPADVPTSRPFGSDSFSSQPLKPIGGGSDGSFGSFYPQGTTNFPSSGSSFTRVVRDDSHEQASGRTTESGSTAASTLAHHRREATTVAARPLPGVIATTQQSAHSHERREASTVRPVALPGSLASSSSSASTSAPKNKREEATTVKATTSAATKITYSPLNKREATTAKVATSTGLLGLKPLRPSTTPASKNKRESSTTIVAPIQPSVRPFIAGQSTTESQSFLSISGKNKRQAPVSADSSADEEPEDDNRQLFNRPTLIPRPNGRPTRPNIFRRTTTPSSSSASTIKASSTTEASKFKRDSTTTERSSFGPLSLGTFGASSSRPFSKRQAPIGAADDDSNRQLLNRPTLIPRPIGSGSGATRPSIFRRTTPASSASTTLSTQAATTKRFRRDVFGTTESVRPYTVETFSGAESLPGQTTYFTGTNVNGQRPDGQHFLGSSVASTSFGTNPLNKRQTDDSSSGEDSQEE